MLLFLREALSFVFFLPVGGNKTRVHFFSKEFLEKSGGI